MPKYQVKNSKKSPRFSGIRTFMRLESVDPENKSDFKFEDVDFVVVGIPFDTCTTFRVGTRMGPAAIRESSAVVAKPYNPILDVGIFEYCSGVDYGDVGSVPGYVEDSFQVIEDGFHEIFSNGVIPIAMGGDHSVTLPELRACYKTHGPVALIHFDAHFDTVHEYFGKPYTHGTPFYHAAIEGLVDTSKSIQVGIREGLYDITDTRNSLDLGYDFMYAADMHKMSTDEIIKRIKDRVGDAKAFLTFDIDFLDPACAPGTGTPIPGGFTTAQALEIIRGLKDLNIIGYDVVEVSQPYDLTGITAIAAAGLMQEFMSHIAWKKKHNITYDK